MFKPNPLTAIDSYKLSHRPAYPDGTSAVYSNFTPRSVKHLNVPEKYKTNEIVWFGGQAVISDMLDLWNEEFFNQDIDEILGKYSARIAPFAGPDYSVDHIRKLHGLGHLPLHIRTLPEGSFVPVGVPVMTVENTDKRFFWLTNYLETYLSAELWKMSTSATIAYYYRLTLEYWANKTGGNKDFIDFQAHDFSYRGMSGSLDAAKSGAGHLTSFKGSDSIIAVDYLAYHYSGDTTFVAASVPATEHSVATAYGQNEGEYLRRMIQDVYPTGIVSVVADSYDYWNFLTEHIASLKDVIMNRQPDAMGFNKVVVRPDSGDPVRIICGYTYKSGTGPFFDPEYEVYKTSSGHYFLKDDFDSNEYGDTWVKPNAKPLTEEEVKGSIQVLWDIFGGTTNAKGYKTLDQHIGLIYGDSITLARAEEILSRLADKGFASDNVVFGVGSYTYQMNTRDTLGFAMKATNITINKEDIPLFKDPKTDDGTKKSARGLLRVEKTDGKYFLINDVERGREGGELTTLYWDGTLFIKETLDSVRNNIKK